MESTCVCRSARAVIPCALCLCLLCAILPALPAHGLPEFSQDDLDLLNHYYLRPVPGSVPEILERLACSKYLSSRMETGDDLSGTAYLFARVARSEPWLAGKYREVLEKTGHTGRLFLIRVLGLMGGEDTAAYLQGKLADLQFAEEKGEVMRALAMLPGGADVCRMPVEKPSDLDMLWAEFMVTGEARAVERIIDVLERPDITREKLEQYLRTRPADGNDGLVAAVKNNLWALCDTGSGKVITCKDLDISLVVMALRPEHPREAVRFIREALGMSDADYYRAALKGSAAWSLMSNAMEHPGILKICTDNAPGRSTPVKMALLCVPACFSEDHLLIDDAVKAFSEMAEEDPSNLDVHLHLMRLAIEKRDLNEARRELALFRENGLDPGRKLDRDFAFLEKLCLSREGLKEVKRPVDVAAVVRETVRRTAGLKSYSSEAFIIPIPMPPGIRCTSPLKFEAEYEKPDRISVTRRMIANPQALPVYERWVTLGCDHYSLARQWYKVADQEGGHDKANALLRIDKWARLLESNPMKEGRMFESQGKRYYCMSFPVESTDDTLADLVSAGKKGAAEIWIDAETYEIIACEIRSTAHDASGKVLGLMFQQVFGDFDAAGPVGPPENFIDISQGGARSLM
jgi:hypothetical protein